VTAFVDFLKSFGTARLAAMGVVALGLVGFFGFYILRVSAPPMVPLYTDLSFDDSRAILAELDGRAVEYDLRQDGAVILVGQDQVLRLRMDLAGDGLPSGGGVGYEIFDQGDTLGATSFVQNINHLRALEGELSRSIRTIQNVTAARVHLVMPERQLFARERATPSASIMLKTRGSLATPQVRAIQHLAAAAVEGLEPNRVSVVDERGTLLADGRGEANAGFASTMEEQRTQVENRLAGKIEEIIASVVGHGRARVKVSADLDMSQVTETADIFDPESRVIRSTQTREEQSSSREPNPNEGVTVGNELPNANGAGANADATQDAVTTEEVVNYEISRTTRTQVQQAGALRRLSVAVLVDGTYTQGENGEMVYAPRSDEELNQITALVRSAVGFSETRGDTIEVANLQFAESPIDLAAAEGGSVLPPMNMNDYFYIAEIAVLTILAILVLLLVVRPLVRQIIEGEHGPQAATATTAALTAAEGETQLITDQSQEEARPEPEIEWIKQAQIAGEVQQAAISQVGSLVNDNPDEAIGVLRQWMQEAT
jgi:flagellar M-ring protein FliF